MKNILKYLIPGLFAIPLIIAVLLLIQLPMLPILIGFAFGAGFCYSVYHYWPAPQSLFPKVLYYFGLGITSVIVFICAEGLTEVILMLMYFR